MPETENFYSHLNIEDVTDADCARAERICKDFEIKKLGEWWLLCSKQHIIVSRFTWEL